MNPPAMRVDKSKPAGVVTHVNPAEHFSLFAVLGYIPFFMLLENRPIEC